MTFTHAIGRYRFLAAAIAGSAALHAAVMVNIPTRGDPIAEPDGPEYSATLDPSAQAADAAMAAARKR